MVKMIEKTVARNEIKEVGKLKRSYPTRLRSLNILLTNV